MKIYMSGNDVIIEDVTNDDILMGQFRNFGGEERKDKNSGRIVNAKGKRNFNLKLNKEQADFFTSQGCTVKTLNADDENTEPDYFTQIKINTETSKNPPKIQKIKTNGQPEEIPVSNYINLNSVNFEKAEMVLNFYRGYPPYVSTYMNLMVYKEHLNPITEKLQAMLDRIGADPNEPDPDVPDPQTEEVPFA